MQRATNELASDEDRSKALRRLTGSLRYLVQLHRALPVAQRKRAVRDLYDALAWGLVAYVHDLAEGPDRPSAEAVHLYAAAADVAKILRDHGRALSKTRLLRRGETHHPSVTDADLRKTFDAALQRVAGRALADAEASDGRGRTATESALEARDELSAIKAALFDDRERTSQPSLAVLDRDLDNALDELVRWGRDDGERLSDVWIALFQLENDFRAAALPLQDRHLSLGASPADVLAMLTGTALTPTPATDSVDAVIDRIGLALERIADGRLRAGRNLERQLHEPEAPADTNLAMILSTALSMAVAGVGGFIASRVVAKLAPVQRARALVTAGTDRRLAPIIASLEPLGAFGPPPGPAAPHFDAGLAEAIQSMVAGVAPAAQASGWLLPRHERPVPTADVAALTATILRDPRSLFIAGLERGLEDARDGARLRLIQLRGQLRTVAVEQLHEVERQLAALVDRAEDAQLYVTMLEWMNFIARWQLGANPSSERAAELTDSTRNTAPGAVTVDYLVDRERQGTGPLVLHDARAGVSSVLWTALRHVAGELPLGRLPINQIYRFFIGTPFIVTDAIHVRIQAPQGVAFTGGHDDISRRALAAIALDLPFSSGLDGAIRHGSRTSHDEGVRHARELAKVRTPELVRARRRLVLAARATLVSKVRADG